MKCNFVHGCPHDAVQIFVTRFPDTHLGPTPSELNCLCLLHQRIWASNDKGQFPGPWDDILTEDEAICWLVMES